MPFDPEYFPEQFKSLFTFFSCCKIYLDNVAIFHVDKQDSSPEKTTRIDEKCPDRDQHLPKEARKGSAVKVFNGVSK